MIYNEIILKNKYRKDIVIAIESEICKTIK